MEFTFTKTTFETLDLVLEVERRAFGSEIEAALVEKLLSDSSAEPYISLLAFSGKQAVGHILFTRVQLSENPETLAHILAPMAVVPEFQGKGIGGALIRAGTDRLKEMGSKLVFVLGHIDYYPRYGFINDAARFGFLTPFPIPREVADAWMVQELLAGEIESNNGKVMCADSLMKPEYWVE